MRVLRALTVLLLTSFVNLSANDCCSPSPACWQGFYLNAQLGNSWTKEKFNFQNANYFNTLGPQVVGNKFHLKPQGFLGGGGIGYNLQRSCFVFGLEASALGLNIKDSSPNPFFPELDTFSAKLKWLALSKARIGYALGCFLPYVSGGWSGGLTHLRLRDSTNNITASSNDWANGWTVGAGFDYKITRCFSLGIGYDYVKLHYSGKTIGCRLCGTGVGFGTPRVSNHLDAHIALFRILINL